MGGPGQNFHFELFERAPLGRTKAFYRMSKLIFVQKLLHFEVRDCGRISCKKNGKKSNFEIFHAKRTMTFNFCLY